MCVTRRSGAPAIQVIFLFVLYPTHRSVPPSLWLPLFPLIQRRPSTTGCAIWCYTCTYKFAHRSERIMYTIPNTSLIMWPKQLERPRGANNGFFVLRTSYAACGCSTILYVFCVCGHNSIAQAEKEFRFNFPTNFFALHHVHLDVLVVGDDGRCLFPPHK